MMKRAVLAFIVVLTFCLSFSRGWAATYTFDGAVDGNWYNPANWQTGVVAGIGDTALIAGGLTDQTLENVVVGTAIFQNNARWNSGLSFTAESITFNTDSYNIYSTIVGPTVFNDASYSYGYLVGDVIFNDNSFLYYYPLDGNATFNDASINRGIVTENAIFNGNSTNVQDDGRVIGTAFFASGAVNNGTVGQAYNFQGTAAFITGNDVQFNVTGENWTEDAGSWTYTEDTGGALSWIFNGTSNIGVVGDSVFNNAINEVGTVEGDAVFNGHSANYYGTVTGNATFNGDSKNEVGLVGGHAIFNDTSVNTGFDGAGTVTGAAFFGRAATNGGNVTSGQVYNFDGIAAFVNGNDVRFTLGNGETWSENTSSWTYADDLSWVFNGDSVNAGHLSGSVVFNSSAAQGGTIDAGASGTVSGDFSTTSGITLQSGTASSDISGTGGVTKSGSGTVTMSGVNTYTGKTVITDGILRVDAESGLGGDPGSFTADQLTLNGGTLETAATFSIDDANRGVTLGASGGTFNQDAATALTIASAIVGTGGLVKSGAGTLVLTGANSYTGTTTVSGGTLQAGNGGTAGDLGTGDILNNGVLRISRSDDLVISNGMSGTGALEKAGAGSMTIARANTFSGGTTISAGTLRAGHANALGTGDVTNSAALDVGTTTLDIGGDYSQAGSALKITANSASDFGSLLVTGTAVVTGAVIDVTLNGYLAHNATLAVVTSVGGLTYNATTINVIGDTHTTLTASVSGGVLTLTASRTGSGFGSLAGSPNAANLGSVLDNITDPSADMSGILDTLNGRGNAQVAASLETLGTGVDGGVRQTSTTALHNFVAIATDRADEVLWGEGPGGGGSGVSTGDGERLTGLWAREYGSYLMQGGGAGYNSWNAGTALGVDRRIAENVVLGLAGSYAQGGVNADLNNATTDIKSAQAVLYGGYTHPDQPYFIDGAVSLAYNWYDGYRDVDAGEASLRRARADYAAGQYGLYLGGGYKWDLTRTSEWGPLVSVQWNRLAIDSYTETGAGALNLHVRAQDYEELRSGLGLQARSSERFFWGDMTAEIHAKWFYDFLADPVFMTASFEGGGVSFTAQGTRPERHSFNVGGQMKLAFWNDISIIGACDAEIRDQFLGIYGSFTLRRDF